MKKLIMTCLVTLAFIVPLSSAIAEMQSFEVRSYTSDEFYIFTKVFAEMRGPLRKEILKDKKTNFENADPLKYVMKIKEEKDVKRALAASNLTWNQFEGLMGNILLSYLSIQPQSTKSAIIKQIAGYGFIPGVPQEYQPMVNEILKNDQGAALAAMAMELAIQIPEDNLALARKNERQLDRFFYTKFWKDKIGR